MSKTPNEWTHQTTISTWLLQISVLSNSSTKLVSTQMKQQKKSQMNGRRIKQMNNEGSSETQPSMLNVRPKTATRMPSQHSKGDATMVVLLPKQLPMLQMRRYTVEWMPCPWLATNFQCHSWNSHCSHKCAIVLWQEMHCCGTAPSVHQNTPKPALAIILCFFSYFWTIFSEFQSVYFIITCSLYNYLTTLFFSPCLTHNYLILYENNLFVFLSILFSYLPHYFPIITVSLSFFCMSHRQPV